MKRKLKGYYFLLLNLICEHATFFPFIKKKKEEKKKQYPYKEKNKKQYEKKRVLYKNGKNSLNSNKSEKKKMFLC